jgi:tetratricopeptide (TPR) repeat protein
LRGQIHQAVQQGNYEAAIRILNHLIDQYPNQAEYYSNRGLMHYYCRQWAAAIADFNRALALQPNADRVYNNRANCYAAQGHWQVAIADYDRAIDLNPFNMRARINQAITFRDIGYYEEALACFDIALFMGSARATIYAERGRTHHLNGHWNCAMGDYQRALDTITTQGQDPVTSGLALQNRVHRWIGELTEATDPAR